MSDSIDPALAHLYGDVADAELEDGEPIPPATETSLEKLTAERGRDEELSDHDAQELAIMLAGRTTVDLVELRELGLGLLEARGHDVIAFIPNRAGARVFELLDWTVSEGRFEARLR